MVASGDVLNGRYKLGERIAAGGMGTVFAATDEKLGRGVALKILRDSLSDDARFVERFRREARSAASLSHPHIAGVYDYGKDGGHHFIVMQHAAGKDLARLLREEGPLEAARAVSIAAQIGEALAAAHAVKMVHRDVKPGNVIVDEHDQVKVTDFGIARASGDSTLTATGSVLGTAHYLSPEQASGGKVEPPSDVYSLGILLYEMLTNTVPFTGDSAVAVAMRHLAEDVPAPSELRPEVPAEVDALVRGATASDPARRYSDGHEFAAAARAALTGEVTAPIAAVSAPPSEGRTAIIPVTSLADRWDPQKVGRYVVGFFVALLALAVVLAAVRVINAPKVTSSGALDPGAGSSPSGDQDNPAGSGSVTIPGDLVGRPATDVVAELVELGVEPKLKPDEDSDLEKGLTTRVEPAEGDSVEEGSEITVFASTGASGEDDDDEDDEKDPPGNSKGKGKGKKDKDD